ncbi:hypothetical protein QTP86_004020 [Hemibagrus guttatus]|nr:hypothetical protein QTP86_004020 [Hemibagrus guttatus]
MLFYWGETVTPDGFGLVNADSVKFTDTGIGYFSPKSRIGDVSLGKSLVGFIRGDGNVSVMRLNTGEHGTTGKLNGQLFMWGQNSNGQLGLGRNKPSSLSPQPLTFLSGIPLAQISAGGDHSFALSISGAVFGWGRNSTGQLGLGDTNDRHVPVCVKSLNQKKTVFISCGEDHTAVLTKDADQANSNLNSCNSPTLLDDETIDCWISDCNPKVWKKIQSDKHYETSVGMSGLDLSLSRLAFEKMAKNDKVLSMVETAVEKDLLPSLGSTAAGVEALRVYLILPELLRVLKKQGRGTELTISLASAILKLEPQSMDVLSSLWTNLPYCYYRTLVKMFHSVCSHFLLLMTTKICDRWTEVEPVLKVLQKLYNVKFALEAGIDGGTLTSEFFTLLGKKIETDSSVIQASEDSGLFWFSADDSGSSQQEYIGVICGMAFYNHNFIYIGFPVALFKKLLNIRPTFRDLEELSPVEARGLKNLLAEDEDVVELLDLDFTVKGKELIPNGAQIPVTKANRQKYVDLYVDFVFNKSVENQFRKFEKGFSHGNPFNFWKIFKPEELRDLLYGTAKYEWKELQKVVTYECCGPSDELIQNFWSVFFELDEEQRKKFLNLEKAYDRVPREELWYCIMKSGVAEKYVRVVQDMYERSRTVVRCAVGQTEEFKVEVGLHQESALSPFLFAIVMDQLSEEVR